MIQGTRVDPAHTVGDPLPADSGIARAAEPADRERVASRLEQIEEQLPPVRQTAAVSNWESADDLQPTLRIQADQLATHLLQRQQEIDHRESKLNAQLANFDIQERNARHWFDERQAELDGRQSELDNRAARLAQAEAAQQVQAEQLAAQQAALEQAQFEFQLTQAEWEATRETQQDQQHQRQLELAAWNECLTERQDALDKAWQHFREQAEQTSAENERSQQAIQGQKDSALETIRQALETLERRRVEIEARGQEIEARALEIELQTRANAENGRQPSADDISRSDELNEIAARLQHREQALVDAEAQLAHSQNELAQFRQRLERERERLGVQARADRQRVVEQQRRQMADFARQKQTFERRGEQLDQRQAALQQMRTELADLHRETLEMRFAVEEIWAQLSGSMPAAALTQSLGDIRGRLSDHFRLASANLVDQKTELARLRDELADRHDKLRTQKHELQLWVEGRHKELEQQAQRLSLREQELDGQETQFRNLEERWAEQRFEYEQQIRRLKSRLGHDSSEASLYEPSTMRPSAISSATR